jgi:hypothetical protein
MKFRRLFIIVIFLPLFGRAQDSSVYIGPGKQPTKQRQFFAYLSNRFNQASIPTKLFYAPTARVLHSMEISISGGSSYGVEEGGGFLTRLGIGLGNVAELEFSTTEVANELTGKETRFPSRILKVNLLPVRFRTNPWIPSITCQLRTSPWGEVVNQKNHIAASVAEDFNKEYSNFMLRALNVQSRFTTLYILAGKDGQFGGIHVGVTLMDVRTKQGWQWIYNNLDYSDASCVIPAQQKNILKPFGGLILNANATTQIMMEITAVPRLRYNIRQRQVQITHTWSGIGGVRFFMLNWLSCDAGVRYLSSYKGIADAEISMALNIVLPLKFFTE